MRNALKFYLILYFVLTLDAFSKSLAKKEISKERKTINSKAESDEIGIEDGIASEHDSVRTKHRHKSGEISKRHSSESSEEENEQLKAECAVMYKNNEPVGILQPFEDSYKFLPISGDSTLVDINPLPSKRKSAVDVQYPSIADEDDDEDSMGDDRVAFSEERQESADQKVGYYDEKFPYLLAKFKINSKLDSLRNPIKDLNPPKRADDNAALDDKQVGSLKSTLSKRKSDDSVAVEEELRDILDQMGLIDEEPGKETEVKREVEDENMETGTNNINMVKKSSNSANVREFSANVEPSEVSKTVRMGSILSEEHTETRSKREDADTRAVTSEIAAEKQAEDSAFVENSPISIVLRKREDATYQTTISPSCKTEQKRDIGLETLPSVDFGSTPNILDDQILNYEKRVEREIRDKIQKLKEEVKKEIDALKSDNKKKAEIEDSRRKKRQVINTLMDEETQEIDPNFNSDGRDNVLVRRKRSFESPEELNMTSENIGETERRNRITESIVAFHSRKLKQINEAIKEVHHRVKRDESEYDSSVADSEDYEEVKSRQKRDDNEEEEAYYYNDESEFADDKEGESDKKSGEKAKKEVDSYEGSKHCKCGKNGNCKCGLDDVASSNIIHDYSNFMVDPLLVEQDLMSRNRAKFTDPAKVEDDQGLEDYEEAEEVINKRSIDKYNTDWDSIPSKVSSKMRKRHALDLAFNQNKEDAEAREYESHNKKWSKREVKPRRLKTFENGEYFVDLHPAMYKLSLIGGSDEDSMIGAHGVSRGHSSSKRRRGVQQVRPQHYRIRRTARSEEDNNEPRQLIDMSEEDIFGALPQSYDGELVRYKRVKRSEAGK